MTETLYFIDTVLILGLGLYGSYLAVRSEVYFDVAKALALFAMAIALRQMGHY